MLVQCNTIRGTDNKRTKNNIHIKASSLSYLYQGGGDYRGIYDTGLKRGFMGYIGLLLNAPYKRDSMMG
jgi:hypothetical protein